MSRRGQYLLFSALIVADAVGVVGGLLIALFSIASLGANASEYVVTIQLALPLYLLVFAGLRLYDLETVLEDSQEYATVATGCTYGIMGLIVLNTVLRSPELELAWLLAGWVATIVTVGLGRFLMRRVVRALRRSGHLITRALIVGADEQGRTIARQFQSVASSGVDVIGFVDDFLPLGTHVEDGLHVIGHPSSLNEVALENGVKEVVVVPGAVAWETFYELLEHASQSDGLRIRLSPGYYDLLANTPRVAHRNFVPLFILDRVRISGLDWLLKASVDYGLGLLALLLSLPLIALIAIVLFFARQEHVLERLYVIGMGGRRFRAAVFSADEGKALGRLLAQSGLTRLPLLFLIPFGRMSLVGPRLVRESDQNTFRRWLPALATMRPGVTGPWAVVPIASLEEEMRAVLYYIRNWTVWLDLQILVQTVLVVLRRRWARLTE